MKKFKLNYFFNVITNKGWKKAIFAFLGVLSIFLLLSFTFSANMSDEVKSVEIESSGWKENEPGSWHITKSAEWVDANVAEIKFDVTSTMKLADEAKDIILVLDTSESMLAEKYIQDLDKRVTKLARMKEDATKLVETVLSKNNNHIALVEFNTSATILSGFTNDTDSIVSKINNLNGYGATNYRAAFEEVNNILSKENYQHQDGRDLVILFLSDGVPIYETPNQVGEYEALKEKYPKMIVHAVQYEMGNTITQELKDISDYQYLADMDNLKNMLFEASTAIKFYEEFDVTDFIKAENFNVLNSDDIEVSKGTFEFDQDNQKVIWHLGSYDAEKQIGTYMSGSEATMTIKAELKEDKKNTIGLFNTNESESIKYHLYNEESETKDSTLTPKLYNGYTVYYDVNPPTGCNISVKNNEIHSVLNIVKISEEEPTCAGYQFKGWKIIEDDETYLDTAEYAKDKKYRINDTSFRMPSRDIHIQATWTKLTISKSMKGTVYEVKKVPLIDKIKTAGIDPDLGRIPIDNEQSKYVSASTGIDFDVASGDTNGKGLYIREGSENDPNPIYYYRGAVTNNNVLFAGFCWKIVRTTETGGIKLVYNGKPTDNQCITTANNSRGPINSAFNSSMNSPAYIGYMYGKVYPYDNITMRDETKILNKMYTDRQYYFTKEVPVWNGSKYVLSGTNDGTNSFIGISADIASKLTSGSGYYTCLAATVGGSCSTVYYVAVGDGSNAYYYSLSNGKTISDSGELILGSGISDNNGTYTLTGQIKIKRTDWYTKFNNYKGYYICSNFTDTTCDALSMHYISSTTNTLIDWTAAKEIVFGNDVEYKNGKYTLITTATKATNDNWGTNKYSYSSIAQKKHYTCLSKEKSCVDVYYIFSSFNGGHSRLRYIKLEGGENIDNALEKMFMNTTDSTIKIAIDKWYETNIDMKNYSSNLENAVWCNDRSIANYRSWNKDNNLTYGDLEYGATGTRNISLSKSNANPGLKDNLACPLVRDRFTITDGSDKGNGNGALKYKIGMLTADEMTAAGNGNKGYSKDTYLYDNILNANFWTLSPYETVSNDSAVYSRVMYAYNYDGRLDLNGVMSGNEVQKSHGARVAISLKSDTKVLENGDGTAANPYRLE